MSAGNNMKRNLKDWFIIIISLLDEIAVTLLILLILYLLNITISLPVIVFLVVFFVAAVFLMHRLVIPALHKKITTGIEGLIGLEVTVVKPLKPEGIVKIKNELWNAESIDGYVQAGKKVKIVAIDGLTLRVSTVTG